MYLQGQKKSPISGKSLGLGFFSLRESFHFLVWLCSLGLRPRLHNCQTAKFIPWSDCVASASGLGYTTVRPRNENFLSRKRNPGRELFHLWSTCFRPYRTFIPSGLTPVPSKIIWLAVAIFIGTSLFMIVYVQIPAFKKAEKRFYEAKYWFSRGHFTSLEYCHTSAHPKSFDH